MKIAIAGAGAMGSRFGVMLKRAGNDVILIDSWAEHVQTINQNGLTVETDQGNEKVEIPAFLPKDVHFEPELVVLFTKSMGLVQMLQDIQPILNDQTKIVCLLNGLGHIATIEKYVKKANIFMGVTLWTAALLGAGHIKLTGDGSIEIQNIDPTQKKAAEEICGVFDVAGLKAKYSANVMFSIWRKACVNGTLNTLCTLLDCNSAQFGSLPQSDQLVKQIVAEFAAVAAYEDVTLDVDQVAAYIGKLYDPSQAGAHFPSMYQDLIMHHRLTEIDYLNGYVAKRANQLGIATPVCATLTALVHAKESLLVK